MGFEWHGTMEQGIQNVKLLSETAVANAVAKTAELAVSETKNNCPVASNFLKTSYTWTMACYGEAVHAVLFGESVSRISQPDLSDGDFAVNIGTPLKYGAYVEFGTGPHFPPIAPIIAWVHQRGLSADTAITGTYSIKTHKRTGGAKTVAKQDEELAFLIARAISRRGTKPQPHLYPGINSATQSFGRILSQEMRQVTK